MIKVSRRFIPALLTATLVTSMSGGAFAFADTANSPVNPWTVNPWIENAPEIEVVDGKDVVFTKDMLGKEAFAVDVVGTAGLQVPGDEISGSFTVENKTGVSGTLYMSADDIDNDVLAQIHCEISSGDKTIYDGALNHVEWKDAVNVVKLDNDSKTEIAYVLSIPTTLGNEVAYTVHDFAWDLQLIADETPNNSDDPNNPGANNPGSDGPGDEPGIPTNPGGGNSIVTWSEPLSSEDVIRLLQTGDPFGIAMTVLLGAGAVAACSAAGLALYTKRKDKIEKREK